MRSSLVKKSQRKAADILEKSHIVITDKEKEQIEICDYGLDMFDKIGTTILTYVNTDRCCAKEIVLFPNQICPEHYHPQIGEYPGKEETFRCRAGEVYLYVFGDKCQDPKGTVPIDRAEHFTVWHEIILKKGEQYTMKPNTKHWFQAGAKGCIVSEFSTQSFDDKDIFTDVDIERVGSY